MLVQGTQPIRDVSLPVAEPATPQEAVRAFLAAYPDARVESIDGVIVRGICALCQTPVMENTVGYRYDSEAEKFLCPAHSKETLQ